MARTKIKVCGVTSVEDAKLVCSSGVDAIGLNFYSESKRGLTVSEGSAIGVSLPPLCQRSVYS